MNKIIAIALFLASTFVCAEAQTTIYINADQGKHTINKNIYGHFAEHLGRCVYGGFYVGEDNQKIPNTEGVRNDVVKALKELKVPVLRWPGGCFADTYHWKDGIGPKADRPSMLNIWWGNVKEDNSFGTNEFLNMCELLETEPYLSANVGSGTPQELADWIKYTNHPAGTSPMPDLREKYGRKEPWKVKYWGIGNEAWGCGGNMTPEFYANIYRQFATFTTDWQNSDGLVRIASGASSSDYNWTEVLMKNVKHNMLEAIALHHYSVIDWGNKGSAKDFSEEQYFKIMQRALEMEELIQKHVAIMDKYDPEKKVDLYVDEWGGWYDSEPGTNGAFLYQQNTMRDAMLAGATLNIFNNHADRVKMANIAQAINVLQAVILTDGEKMILTPTYHVMKMFNVHQDATLLPSEIHNTLLYNHGKESLPAISCSASKTPAGDINISVVNIDSQKANTVTVNLKGAKIGTVKGSKLQSGKIQDHNTFEKPDLIKPAAFNDFKVEGENIKVTVPPFSVVVLNVK